MFLKNTYFIKINIYKGKFKKKKPYSNRHHNFQSVLNVLSTYPDK